MTGIKAVVVMVVVTAMVAAGHGQRGPALPGAAWDAAASVRHHSRDPLGEWCPRDRQVLPGKQLYCHQPAPQRVGSKLKNEIRAPAGHQLSVGKAIFMSSDARIYSAR
jgi:hypothetical protein